MSVDREAMAWAAGFFDGEGTTIAKAQHSGTNPDWRGKAVVMSITQIDTEPLLRFQAACFGLGSIVGPQIRPGVQPQWRWQVTGFQPVQAIVAALWPFLSTPKRRQATGALMVMRPYHAAIEERRTHCIHGHVFDEANTYFTPDGKHRQCRICKHQRITNKRTELAHAG